MSKMLELFTNYLLSRELLHSNSSLLISIRYDFSRHHSKQILQKIPHSSNNFFMQLFEYRNISLSSQVLVASRLEYEETQVQQVPLMAVFSITKNLLK